MDYFSRTNFVGKLFIVFHVFVFRLPLRSKVKFEKNKR